MLDLDRFKAINDERGHVEGDRVLRITADAITKVLRPGDSAYRYGGEEFVVVMLLKEPGEALLAAERLRLAIEDLAIPNPGNHPYGRLTISIGVATVSESALAEDDDGWVARADAALYRAKTGGRNRCEMDPGSIRVEPSQTAAVPARATAADVGRPSR
jgi:diguanylate cyclase (GGDEF)-like protein